MARALRIPRSTVHRLVQVLVAQGFLQRTNGDRDYTLGPAVLTIGFEYLGSLDIVELARPVLTRLRDATGHSTHLCVLNKREIVYLSRYPGLSTTSSSIGVGTRLPAHATVIGRALLADLTPEELRKLYPANALERFTAKTPTTFAALQGLLIGDAKRGYVAADSFFEPGVTTVAASIRDKSNRVVAAVSVTALGVTIPPAELHGELSKKVMYAADTISMMLDAPKTLSPSAIERPRPRVSA